MGLFSKVFKGIKKVVKKIGKSIKKQFKRFGKFMGKLGIVGQIGLGLLLPGIGSMLGSLAGSMIGTSIGGIGGALIKGAGYMINTAVKIGSAVGNTFKTITSGITKVLGQTAGTILSKIPGGDKFLTKLTEKGLYSADKTIFEAASQAVTDVASSVKGTFSMSTIDKGLNKYALADLAKAQSTAVLPDIKTQLADSIDDKMLKITGDVEALDPYARIAEVTTPEIQPIDVASSGTAVTGQLGSQVTGEATKQSLLGAIKELPGKLMDKGVEVVSDIPGTVGEAAVEGLSGAVEQKMYQVSGVKTVPEYNVQNISTVAYIPDFSAAGMSDIGTSGMAYQPVNVMQDNLQQLGAEPFGYAASLYNDISYAQRMGQYGYTA